MTASDLKSQDALGFLTILEHEQQGAVGGYLILNLAGRPLEFHCTAPLKPNRAQQILFGPTLDSYLYGEQIGQTLVGKGSIEPIAICTDVERALSVRDYVSIPVALVFAAAPSEPPASASPEQSLWRVDAAHGFGDHLRPFRLGENRLAVCPARDTDRETIVARLCEISGMDLREPFSRIREAVEEALRSTRI